MNDLQYHMSGIYVLLQNTPFGSWFENVLINNLVVSKIILLISHIWYLCTIAKHTVWQLVWKCINQKYGSFENNLIDLKVIAEPHNI